MKFVVATPGARGSLTKMTLVVIFCFVQIVRSRLYWSTAAPQTTPLPLANNTRRSIAPPRQHAGCAAARLLQSRSGGPLIGWDFADCSTALVWRRCPFLQTGAVFERYCQCWFLRGVSSAWAAVCKIVLPTRTLALCWSLISAITFGCFSLPPGSSPPSNQQD